MDRRSFLTKCAYISAGAGIWCAKSCTPKKELAASSAFFQVSLAQWSLHRALFSHEIEHLDFASIAQESFGISSIEYSNHFFKEHVSDIPYLNEMNTRAKDVGVRQLLIMIDGEGDLGDLDTARRKTAVENHYKWVEAAKRLECHSIRVNAKGMGSAVDVGKAVVQGLGSLSEFAKDFGLNVIVENHGGYSSDGSWLAGVMREVGMTNCGTLPDFGNFCLEYEGDECAEEYDRYKGVEELMPFAKAVSAKTYDFDVNGDETTIDFMKMMRIVEQSGYQGFVGIEYEGDRLSEFEGIKASKRLLEKIAAQL